MLNVKELTIRYPGMKPTALKNINFELPKGAVCFLLGESASGQTTLCLALAGLLKHIRPEAEISGSISLYNDALGKKDFHNGIAITLENPYSQLTGLKRTVEEELAFGLEMRGIPSVEIRRRVRHAADKFGISRLLSRNPKTLSGGETQKVAIVSSYALVPELWILDRPLTELDPLSRASLLREIKELTSENGTIIVITEEPSADIYSIATHLLTITSDGVAFSLNDKTDFAESSSTTSISSTIGFIKIKDKCCKAESPSQPLQVERLGFDYSGDHTVIFENLNVAVDLGECLWITGPNGCGKTTLAKIIAGILKPVNGLVKINGINLAGEPLWKVARYVSYAFQNPDLQIFSTNLWDEVSFGPKVLGYSEARCNDLASYAIGLFELDGLKNTHPHDLNRSQKKRLGLASTFAMDTPIIILDEPTQFQSKSEKLLIKKAINESLSKGKSILCITHDTEFIGFKQNMSLP